LGVVVLVVATYVSPAAAFTISPSGAYVTRSSSIGLTLTSTRQVVSCTSVNIGHTTDSNGFGSSAVGSSTISGCTNPLIGATTARQVFRWTVNNFLGAGPLVGLQITIPRGGLSFSGGSCLFTVGGTIFLGHLYFGALLPLTVTTADAFTVLASTLTVDNAVGCSPALTILNLAAVVSGRYFFDRSWVASS
jgi:hypothetical protein